MSEIQRDAIRAMRRSYGEIGLESLPSDPFVAFHQWLSEAAANEFIVEANAMVLSTLGVDAQGADAITTRTVLLKDVSQGGFTFFTNYSSRKAQALEINDQVTLLFPWYAMERQVSISGFTEKIERSETEDYFSTRPWGSQIGAWASAQSAPLASREELQQRYDGAAEKWPEGTTVPCPPHWGGYRVTPNSIEFWQGRYSRLHDRLRYERANTSTDWEVSRYYP
ncbi:MAG: pyridoxamine 5'-phosphate oxidase [Actinobacteria bacterium]|nr:pyridoxamine 5'-phosphate oxidase [Actinomycetota bacterium]